MVGEPTELRVASACKGSIRFCIETTGTGMYIYAGKGRKCDLFNGKDHPDLSK